MYGLQSLWLPVSKGLTGKGSYVYGFRGQIGDSIKARSEEGSHHDQDMQPNRQLRLVRAYPDLLIIPCSKVLRASSKSEYVSCSNFPLSST